MTPADWRDVFTTGETVRLPGRRWCGARTGTVQGTEGDGLYLIRIDGTNLSQWFPGRALEHA